MKNFFKKIAKKIKQLFSIDSFKKFVKSLGIWILQSGACDIFKEIIFFFFIYGEKVQVVEPPPFIKTNMGKKLNQISMRPLLRYISRLFIMRSYKKTDTLTAGTLWHLTNCVMYFCKKKSFYIFLIIINLFLSSASCFQWSLLAWLLWF
jgi:Na+/melibiose symporter-like transporter